MIVRDATLKDCPRMVRLGLAFRAAAMPDIPFDPAYADAIARQHILADDRVALVLEDATGPGVVGLLLGRIGRHDLAPVSFAQEVLWWIEPAHRGHGRQMLEAFERWARERDAAFVGMVGRDERTGRFYQRAGYQPVERGFLKELA